MTWERWACMQAHITTYSRTEFSHLQHPSALCRAVPRFQPFPHSPSTPHRLTEHLAQVNISVHGVSVATKSPSDAMVDSQRHPRLELPCMFVHLVNCSCSCRFGKVPDHSPVLPSPTLPLIYSAIFSDYGIVIPDYGIYYPLDVRFLLY